MAPPRIVDPVGVYHVNSIGNFGGDIYLNDADRAAFLELYSRVARKREWVTFAYCLMTTHFHFVIRLTDGGLSEGMRELNGCFSRRMNAVNRQTGRGHLFKNRFHGAPIESDSHLLESCRYVVSNPVRAGLCRHPREWRWSSYPASAGVCAAPAFLAVDELLTMFGANRERARAAYVSFVDDRLGSSGQAFGQTNVTQM